MGKDLNIQCPDTNNEPLTLSDDSINRGHSSSLFDNQLLSYKQTAQYLSISEVYLRRLKQRGSIPFILVGIRGVRFRVYSLNQWIREREVK